ncbi:MAG: protein kinase [Corynebacterium sp.]|nr:protein kinase [Corynebacterium sp.]
MNQEDLQALIGPDYKLQWVIGNGGMSTVWLADDLANDRPVAIKVLRPEFSDNREFLDRFRNEASAAETIHSPNVVETYAYQEIIGPAGQPFCYIAMEYIEGESLADLLERNGAVPEDIALDYLEQAANGLAAIHARGFIHRDIKPGNLMVSNNGIVKITDFGIAKAAAAVPLTRTGMVVGTAQYVSPEQAQGLEVTSSTDIYSLGVVGYEMLTGRRPFQGDSSVSVAIAHINDAPPPMGTNLSAQARELIGITLRKDPARRYATGAEFVQAISAVRFGHRPPQPSNATAPVTEYIPTATPLVPPTQAPTAAPTTTTAAPTTTTAATAAPAQPKNRILGWIIGALLLLAALIGLLLRMGSTGTEHEEVVVTTSVAPTSEYVEPTTERPVIQQPTQRQRPVEEQQEASTSESPVVTTVTASPVTVTVAPSSTRPTPTQPSTTASPSSTQATTTSQNSTTRTTSSASSSSSTTEVSQ